MATLDTLQDAVTDLTVETTALLNEVNTKKTTLTDTAAASEASAATAAARAADALASANASAFSFDATENLIENAGGFKMFDTYAEFLGSNPDPSLIVKVLNDETQGDRSAYYKLVPADPVSLELNFVDDEYAIGNGTPTPVFVKLQDFNMTDAAPTTSTSTGSQGDYYIDADYFYYCYATDLWRRTAGSTF